MRFWKRNKNKRETIPVPVLIEQFNDAISDIQEKTDNYQLNRLDQFYNADGVPVTRRIQITDRSYMEVPLITLVNHRSLCLSEFAIVFDADINSVNTEQVKQQTLEMEKNGLYIGFSDNRRNKDTVSVKLSYGNGIKNILS
jgi:hypothetical protein